MDDIIKALEQISKEMQLLQNEIGELQAEKKVHFTQRLADYLGCAEGLTYA